MKKFLASLLAVSMVASMSTAAFATPADDAEAAAKAKYTQSGTPDELIPEAALETMIKESDDSTTATPLYYYDKEDGYPIETALIGPFGYDTDDKNLTTDSVEFGKTAYFLLTESRFTTAADKTLYENKKTGHTKALITAAVKPRLATTSDSTNGLKVKVDWEEGKSLVDEITVTKKKVSSVGSYVDVSNTLDDDFVADQGVIDFLTSDYGFKKDDYLYMVAVTINDSTSTSDADLIGTMTLTKSKKPKADDIDFDTAINVDWEESYRKTEKDLTIQGDLDDVKADTYYALKFDYDEEMEFTFEDESTFTVDVSGQPKTLLYYDTDFNSKIASRNPLAEINFWNGNGAKFNRTGEMFLRVGDDAEDYAQYLYQVNADGTLSEVPGAEYDDGDGGFYFKTRTLGTYLYSDMELETASTPAIKDEVDAPSTPVVPVAPVVPINPGTGARA